MNTLSRFTNSKIEIIDSEFVENTAQQKAGAVNSIDSDLRIKNVTIQRNKARLHSGGGIFLENSDFSSENSEISEN